MISAALVGYGYWGKIIRKYIEQSECFMLQLIYSPNITENGIFQSNINKILTDNSIEAVFVCTPLDTHYSLCKMILESGKHVFCEKPTVRTLQEFLQLEELAEIKHRCFFTDYVYTASPSINLLKRIVKDVGNLQYVECHILQFGKFYDDADVFETIGVHMLSAVVYCFNQYEIKTISFNENVSGKFCVDGIIKVSYEHAFEAIIHCSLVSPIKERMILIVGDSGSIVFDMCDSISVRMDLYKKTDTGYELKESKEWRFDELNNLTNIIIMFYNSLQSNNKENVNLSRTVQQLMDGRFNRKDVR